MRHHRTNDEDKPSPQPKKPPAKRNGRRTKSNRMAVQSVLLSIAKCAQILVGSPGIDVRSKRQLNENSVDLVVVVQFFNEFE
jgi:hypothetical protein